MQILQLCKKFPFPVRDGESIAINQVTKGLHGLGHEVQVLCISTPKHTFNETALPQEWKDTANYKSVFVDTSVKAMAAFKNLFSNDSYNIQRFNSKLFEEELINKLNVFKPDVVILEGVYLASYVECIRKNSGAKIILRTHNVESQIWKRAAAQAKGPMKWYLNLLARRMENFEIKMLNSYNAIIPISKNDQDWFRNNGCNIPLKTIETGIDIQEQSNEISIEPFSVFHLGAMDWQPNVKAVLWFLEKVWPKVLSQLPNAKLFLAGRNFPSFISEMKIPNVIYCGEVDDAYNFMQSKSMMVIPLHTGSGLRIKLIEAMSLGIPVVTTKVGAQGVDGTDGIHFLVADDEIKFAASVVLMLKDDILRNEISQHAKNFAVQNFNNKKLVEDLIGFINQLK